MSEHQVVREGAIARLTVIGGRAVERLTALVDAREAAPSGRIAALRALEAIADQRALDASLRAIDDPDAGVAQAAVRVVRVFLRGPRGATVVDRLTEVALNRTRSEPLRLAAIDVLSALESSTLQPLREALKDDPSEDIRGMAQRTRSLACRGRRLRKLPAAGCRTTATRRPGGPPHAIAQAAEALSLPLLHQLVERIREREAANPRPPGRVDGGAGRCACGAGEPRQPHSRSTTCARRWRRQQNRSRWSS